MVRRSSLFRSKQPPPTRCVAVDNSAETLRQAKADGCRRSNTTSTAKYTLLSFFPKNLFEQFHRACNIYFLCLVLLQLYPPIQTLPISSTLGPLLLVLTITAVKDGYDDYKRHVMDAKLNARKTMRLARGSGSWEAVAWCTIKVGDIVRVETDQPVPADLVLLTTSEESGECYLDTADLDGETNLKRKETSADVFALVDKTRLLPSLQEMRGRVTFEFPNTNLHTFRGTMSGAGAERGSASDIPLNHKNVLLRGCTLRNTRHTVGIVVYSGHDTKIMKNTGAGRMKRTHLDYQLDWLVLTMFVILFTAAGVGSLLNYTWLLQGGEYFNHAYNWYHLEKDSPFKNERFTNPSTIAFIQFPSYIILLGMIVPTSLYVSIEFIRLGQSILINADPKMLDTATSIGAQVRRLRPPIFRRVKPHFLCYEGVSVIRWVVPYKCRKLL